MLGSLFLKNYIFQYNKRNSTDTPELRYVYIFQFVYFFLGEFSQPSNQSC